jgi:general secretion pathway protein K
MSAAPNVARRAKRRKKEQGIALMMVIGAIAVLTVMLAEFQDDTSAELASALADRDSIQAEYMARSATNLARLIIASEPLIRQSISPLFALMKKTPPQIPVWEFSDRLLGAFNDKDAQLDFAATIGLDPLKGKNLGMPGGKFELTIVDEDAKIDLNLGGANDIAHIRLAKELMGLMAPPQYDPIFTKRDATGNYHDRLQICAAILDWADADQSSFNCDFSQNSAPSNGAEDAYYQLLPTHPYYRKNAPFDSLEELHMVTGVDDDFWATFVDPDPTNPKKRIMTVWGQGTVNVNSAPAMTLVALVCAGAPTAGICTDPLQTSAFVTGVTMGRGISMGAPLFGSAADFISAMKGKGMIGPMLTTMLGMKPVTFQSESDFSKSISVESKVFSIYAVGVVKGYRRETRTSIHTVVDFRDAPSMTDMTNYAASALGSASSSSRPAPTAPTSTATGEAALLQNALSQPNPAGTIIFSRIE